MHKYFSGKIIIFFFLIISFLLFSFYPTYYELRLSNNLYDKSREFILEHNYYWPDFNLYLSKVREGYSGRITAVEKYTSEIHSGSLIQEYYVVLGQIGRLLRLDPNTSYQLGRIISAPLLLAIIAFFASFLYRSTAWSVIAFLIVVVSGSFPRPFYDQSGFHIGRYMEWWTNIDALQRITFIPHIITGQLLSFSVLWYFMRRNFRLSKRSLVVITVIGNICGIVFPPSIITLDSVLVLTLMISYLKEKKLHVSLLYFVVFSLPSLLYIFILTRAIPWSALVDFHRTHPMMIPFGEYMRGTGPIFFLGLFGSVLVVLRKDKKFFPFVYWVISTCLFAIVFTYIKEQSPLRFTQTGLFIPLGLLGTYVFYTVWQTIALLQNKELKEISVVIVNLVLIVYIGMNLYMMNVSLVHQTTFITQRAHANIPPVPYPPQTMYPLKSWMDGMRWLRFYTNPDDVVVAEITAGNHIPAYAGNTVYFGQENTVRYEEKQLLVDKFFRGEMSDAEAKMFLNAGRIMYVFFSIQEREQAKGKDLIEYYRFLRPVYSNDIVIIYKFNAT